MIREDGVVGGAGSDVDPPDIEDRDVVALSPDVAEEGCGFEGVLTPFFVVVDSDFDFFTVPRGSFSVGK